MITTQIIHLVSQPSYFFPEIQNYVSVKKYFMSIDETGKNTKYFNTDMFFSFANSFLLKWKAK